MAKERTADPASEKPNPPVLKVGPISTGRGENVSAGVWKNDRQAEDGRTYHVFTMQLESSYFHEKENVWKSSKGFRVNQLAALDFVVRECTRFIFAAKNPQAGNGSSGGDDLDDREIPY